MSKRDPIDEFVREQLASGRFSDYDALVRYALASLKNRQSEIDAIAEEPRPAVESMQRGQAGLIVDFDNIKQEGRKRLALTGSTKESLRVGIGCTSSPREPRDGTQRA